MRFGPLLVIAVLALTACKSKSQPVQVNDPGLPGPVTQIGEHMTPAFTEASSFMHNTATRISALFAENGVPVNTALSCDDSRLLVARPERNQVIRCQAWMDKDYQPHVTAQFSNRWLLVQDMRGVQRVSQEEFNATHP